LQRDCLVIIEINESDSEVISFVVVVQETMQEVTAPLLVADRPEDVDAVRRSLRMGAGSQ
jgi:imidazole glycerol phosphate synthase subunit HisF